MGFMDSFLRYMQLERVNLSPAQYAFTLLALFVSACFAFYLMLATHKKRQVVMELPESPQHLGPITREKLREYDGRDPTKPLLVAVRGRVYDVSGSREFYGAGGSYAIFAGKDASRGLAKMSFDEKDLTDDLRDLSAQEQDALRDWEYKFTNMYTKVGYVVKSKDPIEEQGQTAGLSSNKVDEQKAQQLGCVSNLIEDEEPYIQVNEESVVS